jgi:hypothetical protein
VTISHDAVANVLLGAFYFGLGIILFTMLRLLFWLSFEAPRIAVDDTSDDDVMAIADAVKEGNPLGGAMGRVHTGCFDAWCDGTAPTDACRALLPAVRR